MKTTKNKIIKGIKTLSKAPLYCAIFVSGGLGCIRQEITTIKDTKNNDNDENQIIDPETDQNIPDEAIGQDNPAYKHSSTDEGEDEHNNVDENNNNLDENNNVVETLNNAEKVCTKQKEQPNIPQAATEENNSKDSKTLSPAKNNATKPSNKPDQPKQNVNSKSQNTTSSSPKKHETDSKKPTNPNPKFGYQLSKNTKDEDIEKPKQYTLEHLNKLLPSLQILYKQTKKIKNKSEAIKTELKKLTQFLNSIPDIKKDNQECINKAVGVVNAYITLLEDYTKNSH